jgi:hypothetical protein
MPKKGGPERRRDGREHREYKRDNGRRCTRPTGPLGAGIVQHTSLAPGRDVHDGNNHAIGYFTRRSY